MQLQPQSWQFVPNFDGSLDGTFPTGNKTPNLAWNAGLLPTLMGQQGAPISDNVRAALTGDAAGTSSAVISVVFVSGSDISGWTAPGAGNLLTNPATTIGNGVFKLRATYLGLNVDSPPLSWAITAATSATGTKLITGNGFWFGNQYWFDDQTTQYNANIDALLANPHVNVIEITFPWGQISDPQLNAQGQQTFVNFFAIIDPILAKLKTVTTRKVGLVFKMWQTFFNTLNTTSTTQYPAWMVAKGNWIKSFVDPSGTQRVQLDWDNDQIWAMQTAAFQAIGDRYDNDDHFLMIAIGDESEAVNVAQGGATVMDYAHYNAKYTQAHLDIKTHWPRTLVWSTLNFLPPGNGVDDVAAMCNHVKTLQAAYPTGFAYGGPDPATRTPAGSGTKWLTTWQKIVNGVAGTLGNLTGQLVLVSHVEGIPWQKNQTSPTVLQVYDEAVNVYKAQICIWSTETYFTIGKTDFLAAIAARNGVTAAPPPGNFVLN